MEILEAVQVERKIINDVTLWEEDGVLSFNFEENTIIDVALVKAIFKANPTLFDKKDISTLLNLEGVLGASLEGLKLLNKKLDSFSNYKAILVNNEKTDIIGRIMTNSLDHAKPTKMFKSALQAEFWMN